MSPRHIPLSPRRIGRVVERAMRSALRSFSTDPVFARVVASHVGTDPAVVRQVADAIVVPPHLAERATLALEVEMRRAAQGGEAVVAIAPDPVQPDAPAPAAEAPEEPAVPVASYTVSPPAAYQSSECMKAVDAIVRTAVARVKAGKITPPPRAAKPPAPRKVAPTIAPATPAPAAKDPDLDDPAAQQDFAEARVKIRRGADAWVLHDWFGWSVEFSQRFCEREGKRR